MSMNITKWKTLKLENLSFKMKDALALPGEAERRNGWKMRFDLNADGKVELEGGGEGFEIIGMPTTEPEGDPDATINMLNTWRINVESIDNDGEGSGSWMNYFVEPLLKQSTGILHAVLTWEDGSRQYLRVDDGVYKTADEDDISKNAFFADPVAQPVASDWHETTIEIDSHSHPVYFKRVDAFSNLCVGVIAQSVIGYYALLRVVAGTVVEHAKLGVFSKSVGALTAGDPAFAAVDEFLRMFQGDSK